MRPSSCPHCLSTSFHRKGHYLIRILKAYRRRYLCNTCGKSFSTQTFSITYRQKRPDYNSAIKKLLILGLPQRGIAKYLNCSKNTVDHKFKWIAQHTHIPAMTTTPKVIFIDEMESIEHTKLKPLTLPLAVSENYDILATEVGRIPAKGKYAWLSRKKYGKRPDERNETLRRLFTDLSKRLPSKPQVIKTDGSHTYRSLIKEFFPGVKHEVFISREQIKKKRDALFSNQQKRIFDPLFPLNQRCAKLRANTKRLNRRSWCTTKLPENLRLHLKLFQSFQNL